MYFNYLDGEPQKDSNVPAEEPQVTPVSEDAPGVSVAGKAEAAPGVSVAPETDDAGNMSGSENASTGITGEAAPEMPGTGPGETAPKETAPGSAEPQGRLERLEARIQSLMQESVEYGFTEYLRQMRSRVINHQYQVDLLADELDRNYRIYQAKNKPVQNPQNQQNISQTIYRAVPQTEQRKEPQQKNNLEFTIGAAVLSIVGSVFILIALVLLGINFLNGFVKGMSLYVICFAVMAVSELVLYKRWQKLGITFSAISMGGLYLSTLLNYLWLDNFNMWVAFGLTCLITVGVILMSRKKDAVVYRILGMAAVYVCILMLPTGDGGMDGGASQVEFLVVAVILFLINVMCLLVPVRRSYTAVNITHMCLNTLFTMIVCYWWVDGSHWASFDEMWQYPFFVAGSLLITQLIFAFQLRWLDREKPDGTLQDNAGFCIAYGCCAFCYSTVVFLTTNFPELIDGMSRDVYLIHRLACAVTAVLICGFPLVAARRRQEKWISWYLLNVLLFVIFLSAVNDWELAWCLAVLLAASKIFSFKKEPMLRISDAVVTTFVCLAVMINQEKNQMIPLFVVLVLSVPCMNYWKVYFETILTFTIAYYTSMHMLQMLKLPVFVGILFAGMLLFNNVQRWRDEKAAVYNYLMLSGQIVCYAMLANPVYQNAYLTYLCMLIFGVSTIVICFQESYQMGFRFKQMALVGFLTYMALVVRTNYPIVNSILMMLIALVAVGMGFAGRKKSVRIYGLVLSLVVCGKIVLYDFNEAPVLQKTIVFFTVGVLALAISAIYMVLEKKQVQVQMGAPADAWTENRMDGQTVMQGNIPEAAQGNVPETAQMGDQEETGDAPAKMQVDIQNKNGQEGQGMI